MSLRAKPFFVYFQTCAKRYTPQTLLGGLLKFLPSYSPELQPAESAPPAPRFPRRKDGSSRLWPLTNEPIVNRAFDTIEEFEEVLLARLKVLMEQPEFIHGLTCFHWWPRIQSYEN